MSDVYAKLGGLGARITEIDLEIEKITAPLRSERGRLEAEISKLAVQIVAANGTAEPEPVPVAAPEVVARFAMPPRRRKLLLVMASNRGADYGVLCSKMYGKDNPSTRGALSAELSGLKVDGFVESIDRGQYRLSPLGHQAVQFFTKEEPRS